MLEFFAHFGLAIIIMIADVLLCTFSTWLWSKEDNDISQDLFILLAIINTAGFTIALSFLILG